MTLSILIWLPLAMTVVAIQFPARLAGRAMAVLSLAPLGVAIYFVARFNSGIPGLQFVTEETKVVDPANIAANEEIWGVVG